MQICHYDRLETADLLSDFIMSHNGEPSSFTCHRMVDCKGGAAYTCPWGVPYLPSMMRWRKLQQAGAPLLKRFCQCHTMVQG